MAQRALSGNEVMEEIKLTENMSKAQGQPGSALPQDACTKVAVALSTCPSQSCGLVSLYRLLGPEHRIYSNVLWRPSG